MTTETGRRTGRATIVTALLLHAALLTVCRADASQWHFPNATLRFEVEIRGRPDPASAGCIVTIPDGGILPSPRPGTVVVDSDGHQLEHGCLWHDPAQGLALVTTVPAAGSAYVYVRGASRLNTWTPASGLTPGMLVYARHDVGSLDAARELGKRVPAGRGVHFATFSSPAIGGHLEGRARPFSVYMTGYVRSKDPGQTWVAPIGPGEVAIDGRRLKLTRRSDKSGGMGEVVQITSAPHRIELFGFFGGGRSGGAMRAAWRTPGASVSELGGPSIKKDGTSAWEARPIRSEECVRSAQGRVVAMRSRTGDPIAAFTASPQAYFWGADEQVVLYAFEAQTAGNPKDTTYTWDFGQGWGITGKQKVRWLLDGVDRNRVGLNATAGRRRSACAHPVSGLCPGGGKSDLNNSRAAREDYREILFEMFSACPDKKDPTAAWGPAMWDLFFRVFEPGTGKALLAHIFTKRWDVMRGKLPRDARWQLEDLFIEMAPQVNVDRAMHWADEFERREGDPMRKKRWTLARIEILMFHKDDLDEAAKLASWLGAMTSQAAMRAQVRLGDIALLRGDTDAAFKAYGKVQTRVRHMDHARGGGESRAKTRPTLSGLARSRGELDKRASTSGLARSRDELDKRRAPPAAVTSTLSPPPRATADWRVGAVRDTAVSEQVRTLLEQGYYVEAKRLLAEWEMEFPLSKITGDYIIMEARYLMASGDHRRAWRMLSAYCNAVDVTNYLPEAMKMTLTCMMKLKRPEAELREFAVEMAKRFKYHPVGKHAESLVGTIREDE